MKPTTIACSLIALGLATPSSKAQITYSLSLIGTPGITNFTPAAINNLGQIVGSQLLGGQREAVLYSGSTLTPLGKLPGQQQSWATDINDAGAIVGYGFTSISPAANLSTAFLYSNGTLTDLSPILGATFGVSSSQALSINNAGQFTGSVENQAYLYNGSSVQLLGYLPYPDGSENSVGTAINQSAQVAGNSIVLGQSAAFLYNQGAMSPIAGQSTAIGINGSGQIVGYLGAQNSTQTAFLYENGNITEIGDLGSSFYTSVALAINSSGLVIGYAANPIQGLPHPAAQPGAFIYSETFGLHFLYEFVTLSDGTTPGFTSLGSITDINDLGQIIGQGTYFDGTNSFNAPYILEVNTITEPSAFALVLLPLAALLFQRYRRLITF